MSINSFVKVNYRILKVQSVILIQKTHCPIQQIFTHGPLAVCSVCAVKNKSVFVHSPGSVKAEIKKVAQTEPQHYFSQSVTGDIFQSITGQGEGTKGGRGCRFSVVALEMHVFNFRGGASEESLKEGVY